MNACADVPAKPLPRLNRRCGPRRSGLLIALLLALAAPPASSVGGDVIDRYVEAQLRELHLPGLSLAVVRQGEVIKLQGYGYANLEHQVPATPATVYEVGSVTKQFTAALVLLHVEDGAIDLDDPLSRYFADGPEFWNRITVRHLLSHTGGIQNHVAVPGYLRNFGISLFFDPLPRPPELLERLYALPREFEPGETWAYDNTGYLLLGLILEQVSGRSFWALLQERILGPLGMTASRSTDPRPLVPHRAAGYGRANGVFENRAILWPHVASSAGSLSSTVEDLVKWDAALADDRLLRAESRDLLWTPVPLRDGAVAPVDYGFGWFIDTDRGHRIVQHTGGTPGFSSAVYRFLDDELSVLILSNLSDRILDTLAIDIAGLVEPALQRPEKGDDPDPALTQRLRAVFEGLLRGEHDPAEFTPAMRRYLATATGTGIWSWFVEHGPVTSFGFSSAEPRGDDRVWRYAVGLGGSRYWFTFRLTADDRVAQIVWW